MPRQSSPTSPRHALLSALLLVAALLPVSAAGAQTVIPLTRYHAALWTAEVIVDGTPRHLLFDTGGGLTMLSPRVADAVDCRWWGRVTGYDMFGTRIDSPRCDGLALSVAGLPLSPATVGRIDLGERIAGDDDPDGILSLDAFDGRAITLDMGAGRIVVETPDSLARRIEGMRPVPVRLGRGCNSLCLDVFAGVPLVPGMAWFTLDSGAGGVSLVARDLARWVGAKDGVEGPQPARFELVPGMPVETPMAVVDLAMDGHLGQPFLSKHVVTLDLANGRMWMSDDVGAEPAGIDPAGGKRGD